MAWSYSSGDLGTDTESARINTVRLLVGDTDTNDQQVQNEEIIFALSENRDNVYLTASWIAKTIASKYARKVDVELDGALSANYSSLAKQYYSLAKDLEHRGKKEFAKIRVAAGGLTISDIESARSDTNRVPGAFRRDRFWNPPGHSGEQDYS